MSHSTQEVLNSIPTLHVPPENSYPVDFSAGKPREKFSREDYMARRNGLVYGAWESSITGACMEAIPQRSYIEEIAIAEFVNMGACANGRNVIKVILKG
ncbi:hypothetical protein NLO95_14765 [Pseudomonas syringae]|nr:hypothetical protein [Pseudomonas syringae]